MDRIYQVFVSSTFVDLKDERQAVVTALLELEAMPGGMELFPAADDDAWTLIKQVISSCDYYLLVIGGKYGSVDPETELSYTEREYDFAVANGKPVMAFLHGEPEKIEHGKSEQEAPEKLEAFRKKVEGSKHVKYWTSPEDLAGKVARTFSTFKRNYPAVGWVRGDVITSSESLKELNALRKELDATRQELASVRTGPPAGSNELAQGTEEVELPIFAKGFSKESLRSVSTQFATSVEWNEMFSKLGPLLFDECEEGKMLKRLNSFFTVRRESEAEQALKREAEAESVSNVQATIPLDTFGTVVVQFKALGLIERSERKRSVSDSGTYWTLTPYGEDHLTSLRAIRRTAETPSVETKEDKPSAAADDAKAERPEDADDAAVGAAEVEQVTAAGASAD